MAKIQVKPVQAKICGITNEEDALWAVNLGADFVGLNFFSASPRKVSIEKAHDIAAKLPPFVKVVGVFVNPILEEVERVLKKVPLAAVQFHGDETKEDLEIIKSQFRILIWKAVRVQDEESLKAIPSFFGVADMILLDTFKADEAGGIGEPFNWDLAVKAKSFGIPIMLAGGLNPSNVQEAMLKVEPKGVDVASGVEKDGHPRKKDIEKMKAFLSKAKGS